MKKTIMYSIMVGLSATAMLFSSCSGCVKRTTKELTKTGLDAIEGISEAVDEHGERVGEKATDAAGKLAQGVGRSLDKQMNEHAEKVASVLGRTLVQSVDGLEKGVITQYYDSITYSPNLSSGIHIDYFGKLKSKSIIDTYFTVVEKGTYKCDYQFIDKDGKIYLTKDAEIVKTNGSRRHSLVSFALSSDEEKNFINNTEVKITVTKK